MQQAASKGGAMAEPSSAAGPVLRQPLVRCAASHASHMHGDVCHATLSHLRHKISCISCLTRVFGGLEGAMHCPSSALHTGMRGPCVGPVTKPPLHPLAVTFARAGRAGMRHARRPPPIFGVCAHMWAVLYITI